MEFVAGMNYPVVLMVDGRLRTRDGKPISSTPYHVTYIG